MLQQQEALLKNKGHDEKHCQSNYSIFITTVISSLINTTMDINKSIKRQKILLML